MTYRCEQCANEFDSPAGISYGFCPYCGKRGPAEFKDPVQAYYGKVAFPVAAGIVCLLGIFAIYVIQDLKIEIPMSLELPLILIIAMLGVTLGLAWLMVRRKFPKNKIP